MITQDVLRKRVNELQASIDQTMANLNVMMGAKGEIERLIKILEEEESPCPKPLQP
jgi:hypothetical protein